MKPIMTSEQINAHAKTVLHTLLAGLPEEWGDLVLPQVCAALFEVMPDSQPTVRHLTLELMFENYVGQAIHAKMPNILALSTALERNGFGEENAIEFSNDTYIYAVAKRHGAVKVKAFVLETRSGNYIVVLNRSDDNPWSMHVRHVYPALKDEIRNDGFLDALEDYKDRNNLSIHDVVRLSKYAEKFADDVEGNAYPTRWSLKSFLESEMVVGTSSCAALRCGGLADDGYIASLTYDLDQVPVVKGITNVGHAKIAEVMYFLGIAYQELVLSAAGHK